MQRQGCATRPQYNVVNAVISPFSKIAKLGSLSRMWRYGLAAFGPIGTAIAQFLLSIKLAHSLAPEPFGNFAFLLITSQFCGGLWSALFCAPLPIIMSKDEGSAPLQIRCLFSTCLALSILAFFLFLALTIQLDVSIYAATLFSFFSAVFLLRWFARAYAYATESPYRTTASDAIYSLVLIVAMAIFAQSPDFGLQQAFGILLASAVLSLLPFGRKYLAAQFLRVSFRDLLEYRHIWRRHSGWSLLGVVTTEATANAHAYLVTFACGSAAFAPIAASALIIRPIGVVMNALTDFERPQLARLIKNGTRPPIVSSVRIFRLVLVATWLGTIVLAGVIGNYFPRVIPSQYSGQYLLAGSALWMGVAAMRLMRTPESALLQAAGSFRWLAVSSIYSCVASIATVAVLIGLVDPLYSIGGVLLGEGIFAIAIWIQARRLFLQENFAMDPMKVAPV